MIMDTAFSGLQLRRPGSVYANSQLACWPCAKTMVCDGPAARCRVVGSGRPSSPKFNVPTQPRVWHVAPTLMSCHVSENVPAAPLER